jgi:RNA polymerase sigma-70 factor (ECF subfamily)
MGAYGEAAAVTAIRPMSDDDSIIKSCQDGDRSAFRELVERYGDVLFGTALLMTRDRSLAEDLTQEALVKAWRGIGGFKLGSPAKPWLVRIVVNQVMTHRRRRLFNFVPLPFAERRDGGAPGPAEIVEQLADHEDLRKALASLPEDQRRLLVLRYYTEMTVPDIARTLGKPEGTVKSGLHRALERLREELGDRDIETREVPS